MSIGDQKPGFQSLKNEMRFQFEKYSRSIFKNWKNNDLYSKCLTSLQNEEVVVVKSDKGNSLVVLDTEIYKEAGDKFLSGSGFSRVNSDDNEKGVQYFKKVSFITKE